MFLRLLLVTFLVAAATSATTLLLFSHPLSRLLARLVTEQLAAIWKRYILFAAMVVGVSGGVRVWELERYINPDKDGRVLPLTPERWVVEIYKTIIGALQSMAWMLLIFFLVALLAYGVVRGLEQRRGEHDPRPTGPA